MGSARATQGRLARCHGYAVTAGGRPIGSVETPIFPSGTSEPDYLIIRTVEALPGTFRVISTLLLTTVDTDARTLVVDLDWDQVAALPERLPLERR